MDKNKLLKAIADDTRMNILTLLLRHNYCVRALANELNLSEATISQHLKVLREAGLLVGEKRGYYMHYTVERDVLQELAKEIESLVTIKTEICLPETQKDCPANEKQECHKKKANVTKKRRKSVTAKVQANEINSMAMVSVKNLKKTYGKFTAVDDISFEIQKGEIFGFLGPNGAGKTSTINMIIGLSRPTAGEITVDGIDVRKQTKKAQSIMGIVPDESNLYNEMDGFNNLCFCAALYGMRKKRTGSKSTGALELFKLKDAGKRPFKAYSKGMRRKLTIAAALIHSPPQVLFLDEPTTGIDVESSRQIREMIVDLKKQGTTVFLTTHYIEEAERICDRIAFIANGHIVALGTVPKLMGGSISHGHGIHFLTDKNAESFATELETCFKGTKVTIQPDHSLVMVAEQRIPLFPVIAFFFKTGGVLMYSKPKKYTLL